MQEIDPRFKAAQQRSAARARRGLPWGLISIGLVSVAVVAAAVWAVMSGLVSITGGPVDVTEEEGEEAATPAYVSAFIDVPGDPLVLAQQSGATAQTSLVAPRELEAGRTGGELVMISDVMISSDEALNTTMPASREEFAFFQSQSEQDIDAGLEDAQAASTSLRLIPDFARYRTYDDLVVRLTEPRTLEEVLAGNNFSLDERQVFENTLAGAADLTQPLGPGAIVAVRYEQAGVDRLPFQISLYGPDGYMASAAVADSGEEVAIAGDPWVDEDLYAMTQQRVATRTTAKYRLIDAIYSTALRNGMSSALLGEAIVAFSKAFDTDAFANPGDRLTLVYSPEARDGAAGIGQILYAGIERQGGVLQCYITRGASEAEYRCWGGSAAMSQGPRLRAGLSPPVAGVMRAGYGPRSDPDTGKVEVHPGVDWAAPRGSPVRSASAGTVLKVGEDARYGNVVELTHAEGVTTFYGHLERAADLTEGAAVTAGEVIGFVGTSGQTNVPHLHFEYREKGKALDPFVHDAGGLAGEAVTALVNQIIRVESGSTPENAAERCAANPASTAVGPGQFITSTWIRMMKSYRADLYGSLEREDLLKLRCDYTLSYEMVTNLAKEGEAYISSKGHEVTAGRLYLAHFLGAGAAADVLGAPPDSPLEGVVSAGVFKANQFLVKQGIDTPKKIEEWADKKMRGRGGSSGPPPMPTEVLAYKGIIDTLLAGG